MHSDRASQSSDPCHPRATDRCHEDAALLTGRAAGGTMSARRGTLCWAALRSPHAHAELLSVDATAALAMPGVRAVDGEDVSAGPSPFVVGVKAAMQHWALAVDHWLQRANPSVVVIAEDRYSGGGTRSMPSGVEYRPWARRSTSPGLRGRRTRAARAVGSNGSTSAASAMAIGAGLRELGAARGTHRAPPAQQLHADGVRRRGG